MSAINDNNFVTIQGWMRTKLNLKGNELLAYAVIYGFSQTDGAKFTGSRKYLAEWCGCSLATIDRTLNSLVDKGLISRTSYVTKHGYRAVEYAAMGPTHVDEPPTAEPRTADTDAPRTPAIGPQPLLNEPQAPAQPKEPDPTEEIVAHLNRRAGTHYKATTANTRKLIKARLKEGFTIDEIKLVIDKKCAEWLNNPSMVEYLRPETLFGNKFEGYLNSKAASRDDRAAMQYNGTTRQPISPAAAEYLRINKEFADMPWPGEARFR
nr:MAG: Replication initiator protein A (RepA) N-terminus [Bacteriophage sp.]